MDRPAGARPARVAGRAVAVAAVVLAGVGLVLAWPSLAGSLTASADLLADVQPYWLVAAVAAQAAVMAAYGRMQRHLLWSAGVRVSAHRHVALAYAAHSLSATLPAGPAFSTRFNFQQMRRFGATPAVASWCITLSGLLSAAALAVVTTAGAIATGGVTNWRGLVGLAVAGLLVAAGLRRLRRHGADATLGRLLAVVNRVRHRPADTGLDRAHTFLEQLHQARLTPGHGAAAAAFALLNWSLDAACLWLCLHAVGGDTDVSQILLAFTAGSAAATLTIVPAGLGIIDGALVLGLVTAGVATPPAVAAVVLYRIITVGFVLGTGWVIWLLMRRSARNDPVPRPSAPDHPPRR